jgi:hypothetical protein
VKLGSRSSTTTVLCWKWVPNFYCDPVPSTSDGAAAARGLCFLLVPQGLNSCSKPAGVFFGSIANTSESRAIGMPCMLSSWTCSLTLPGVDLRLVRLRPGMLASLRTRLRDSLAWSSLAPRTLQCCVLLACSAHGLLEQTRSRFHGQFVLYGRVWGCLHPFGRGCETSWHVLRRHPSDTSVLRATGMFCTWASRGTSSCTATSGETRFPT